MLMWPDREENKDRSQTNKQLWEINIHTLVCMMISSIIVPSLIDSNSKKLEVSRRLLLNCLGPASNIKLSWPITRRLQVGVSFEDCGV